MTSIWLNFKVEHMCGRLQLSRTVHNHRRPNLPLKVGFCTCAVLLVKYHWEQLLLINWRTQSTYSLHDHEHYAARSDFSCDDLMMHLRHYLTKRRILSETSWRFWWHQLSGDFVGVKKDIFSIPQISLSVLLSQDPDHYFSTSQISGSQ